jgi:signal transduction histidine kinase
MPLLFSQYVKTFFVWSIFFFASLICFSQDTTYNKRDWEDLKLQYKSGKIDDTGYLNKIQGVIKISYKDSSLKEKLNLYKKIAWSKRAYQLHREFYYLHLTNNSIVNYKFGAAIYYAEKYDEVLKNKKNYTPSLLSAKLSFFIYGRNTSGYNRNTNTFIKLLPFLQNLPKKIIEDSVPNMTCLNAINILSDQTINYFKSNDSANIFQISKLSDNIYQSILTKENRYKKILNKCLYSIYCIKSYERQIKGNFVEMKEMLQKANVAIHSDNNDPLWQNAAQSDLFIHYFNFFIQQKQKDSAQYYLQKIKPLQEGGLAELADGTIFLMYNAKLKAIEGDYKNAFESTLKAYNINDSVIGVKTADITNNLYAQTLAEEKTEALKIAEEQKQKRNILIGSIALISLLSITILIFTLRKKEKEAAERIYKLNYASQLQIMELEEKNILIKKEEQKKLGMDLHDDLAGMIAGVKLKVESELFTISDPTQEQRLKNISKMITEIYERTRNKSHELYHGQKNEIEIPFSKRIMLITDNSISSNKLKTSIEVDDKYMNTVSLPIKIQLLYIIQEAVTNTIKHSSGNKISILIYEDTPGLVLQIIDNGKGFDPNTKNKGIGLNSMQNRIEKLKGSLIINSDKSGTSLNFVIPTETIQA